MCLRLGGVKVEFQPLRTQSREQIIDGRTEISAKCLALCRCLRARQRQGKITYGAVRADAAQRQTDGIRVGGKTGAERIQPERIIVLCIREKVFLHF